MALTKDQLAAREGKLTASRVGALMSGDNEKILNLWREMIGDPAFVPEDLSDVWAVQLGSATESLQLDWYEKKHGLISSRGAVLVHPDHSWAAATLDGMDIARECPVECKHVGGFEKLEIIIQRYIAQMHWQMLVVNAKECALSVIMGAREPTVEYIKFDKTYGDELFSRAIMFMEHVRAMTCPVVLPEIAPPVVEFKEYDLSRDNGWVSAANDWLETKILAKKFEDAKDALKEKIPRDARRVWGGGIEAIRDKAGRIRIGEHNEKE